MSSPDPKPSSRGSRPPGVVSEIIVDVDGRIMFNHLSAELLEAVEPLMGADPAMKERYRKLLEFKNRKGQDRAK